MAKQGAWTRWEGVTEMKISWEDLCKVEPVRMQFMLKSTYDLLPIPSTLVLWNKKEEADCALCEGYTNLKHVRSCCKVALTQGRYRWRHDQVLRVIAESIEKLRRGEAEGKPSKNIVFIKEGTSLPRSQSKGQKNLISTADDWKLDVDLNKKLVFPREIVMTYLRPDIVLSSQKAKAVVMIELTVLWEDHIEEANERKRLKYDELRELCTSKGWAARCLPVEVGVRGFPAQLVHHLSSEGKNISEAAERASNWLWIF